MTEERKLHLPYLFHALFRAPFTGALSLQEGQLQRTVFIHNGLPVHVQSKLQEETLGRILLDEGKLSQMDYNEMLNRMVQLRRPAGEILIAMGVLGPQDVFSALEFQTRKKLINCFKMVNFGFELKQRTVPPEMLIARLDITEVIFTGIRVNYSVDRLLSEFPVDEDTAFTTPAGAPQSHAGLGPKEDKVYRAISTASSLARLMKVVPDLKLLLGILYSLHALRLIEVSGVLRPSVRDLDLPGLPDEPAPPEEAPDFTSVPTQEDLSTLSEGAEDESAAGAGEEPTEETGAGEDAFSPPTLADVQRSIAVQPLLAEKMLAIAREDHFSLLGINRQTRGFDLKNAFFRFLRTYHLQEIEATYPSPRERAMAQELLDRATMAFRELSNEDSRNAYIKALSEKTDMSKREVAPRILADVEAQKGELALSGRRFQEAIERYSAAAKAYPGEPSYEFQLGVASYMKALEETPQDQPLPEEIRKPFLRALAINPRYDRPHLYLGYISKRNGDAKHALKAFEAAAEYNPDCKPALSEIRLLKKRLQEEK